MVMQYIRNRKKMVQRKMEVYTVKTCQQIGTNKLNMAGIAKIMVSVGNKWKMLILEVTQE